MATEIRTPRMLLLPLRESDRQEFVRVYRVSWELFRPWMPALPPGVTFHDVFDRILQRSAAGTGDGGQVRLAGFTAEGTIAGFFNLTEIVRGVFQNAYASWAVNAELNRQGYATEGVRALLDHAFAPSPGLALHRVQANIIPTNAASLRVAEKAGFRREGYAPRYLLIDGEWQDHVLLARLADEHVPSGPAHP